MSKITSTLTLFMFACFYQGYAQMNEFNLSDYKLPVLERTALETNFNMAGYNNYSKIPATTTDRNQSNSNEYNSSIYINYKHFLNTQKYQRASNFGLKFSSYFYNRKEDDDLIYRYSKIDPVLYFQRDNRNYYNANSFFETDLIFNYQYTRNNRYSKNSFDGSESKGNLQTHTLLASVPLKLGRGRIEPVQDARQAIYLLDELRKVDRVSSNKSDEEIIAFAELISTLKNKRYFDSRLQRIAEIESVDSFLMSKDYVIKSDAKYFTTLRDFWDYGNRPYRNSGTRISGAILPVYYSNHFNNTGEGMFYDTGKINLNTLALKGGVELQHEKPLNLYWQNSIDFNGYAGIMESKANDVTNAVENKFRIPIIQLKFFQTIRFYPNTRTDMSFRYSAQYIQLFDKSDMKSDLLGIEGKGVKAAMNLSVNYYISPKFRLNVSSSIYYIWQDSRDEIIIDFDNVFGSDYLFYNSNPNYNGYYGDFKQKELKNFFRLSLIYTIL